MTWLDPTRADTYNDGDSAYTEDVTSCCGRDPGLFIVVRVTSSHSDSLQWHL